MRFIALILLYVVTLFFVAERQLFDSTIPCLENETQCPDTPSDFKDDSLDPPASYDPYQWEPDITLPFEENVDSA